MKFQTLLSIAALLALVSATPACHDHHHDDSDDTVSPELTISAPTENQLIEGAVQITLRASDETSLHEMHVKVTKDSDGSTVFENEPTVHDKTEFTFDEAFTPSGLSADTPMTLTVDVEDHAAHKVTKTVKFTAKL
ncbi:MAG: hypothetical protein ACKVUS_13405 [Saprospiraceae bacterium]